MLLLNFLCVSEIQFLSHKLVTTFRFFQFTFFQGKMANRCEGQVTF